MATPRQEDSLAKALGRTHLMYARHINRMHGRCGHLWQDRFFSSSLDEEYFWTALIYVERKAVRAGVVGKAWEYRWSSALAHVTGRDDMGRWRRLGGACGDWRESLSRGEDEQVLARFRRCAMRNCPMGRDSFISKLERRLGRRLRPLPIGRPKKDPTDANGGARQL